MGICFNKQPAPEKKSADFTKIEMGGSANSRHQSATSLSQNLQKRPSVVSVSRVSNSNNTARYHPSELGNNIKSRGSSSHSGHLIAGNKFIVADASHFDDGSAGGPPTRSSASASSSSSSSGVTSGIGSSVNSESGSRKPIKIAYKALFDYDSRTDKDLSFKIGDILYVYEEDKKANGWWRATLKETGQTGIIPAQYVAPVDSVESQPWYFGQIKRMEAEKLLSLDSNKNGSFLVRISDGNNHAYSLSVKDLDTVKHYRIHYMDGKYYITKKIQFSVLSDLISHYNRKQDGLCVQLTGPCVRVDKPITKGLTYTFMNNYEMDKSKFKLEKRIG